MIRSKVIQPAALSRVLNSATFPQIIIALCAAQEKMIFSIVISREQAELL
jgi:hypothetical protein